MIFAFAILLSAVGGGALATYFYDSDAPLLARLCAGACIGLALLGLVGFILSSLLGFTPLALCLVTATVASPFALLLRPSFGAQVQSDIAKTLKSLRQVFRQTPRRALTYLGFYLLVTILLWAVFDRAMFEQNNRIYTGVLNNYGDLPFHLSAITRFLYGDNFIPEDPTFAGARFTYPFLADFIAAMFARAGASLRSALLLENLVLALALVGLLHRWAYEVTRDHLAALLSPVLTLLNGGLGWWFLLRDARQTEMGVFPLLTQLPRDYTIMPDNWRWGNAVTSLLVTQRSLLLGLPLAIIIITQWWRVVCNDKAKNHEDASTNVASRRFFLPFLLLPSSRRMIAAGAVTGLLPLAHAHSFVVVMTMGACLALVFWRWRAWAVFFTVALLIATPQLWWSTRNSAVQAGSFFEWHFGWDRGEDNFFWFWLKNTGVFIPLLVAAIAWRGKMPVVCHRLLLFYLPFVLCFIMPNLFKLAPWVWDNIKVLIYWYLASVPLVALLLVRMWRNGRLQRGIAIVLMISLTLAGSLDILRVLTRASEFEVFNESGIKFAEMIKRSTDPRSLILHAPVHNHPVFLTGRRSLMGFPGHVWTHGIDSTTREADIKAIYAGAPDAEALLAHYGIDYVVVGPLEHVVMPVNDAFFERFNKIGDNDEYHFYKLAKR